MKKFDVVHRSEGQNGKVYWKNCGAVFEKDGKFYLKMEMLPIGSDGFFSLFEPKDREDTPRGQAEAGDPGFDDDIGF